MQQADGSIRYKSSQSMNDLWMTAYALPAFAGWPLADPGRRARRRSRPAAGHAADPGADRRRDERRRRARRAAVQPPAAGEQGPGRAAGSSG